MEKFEIYQNLKEQCNGRPMFFYWDEIPVEAREVLTCSCCGLLLKDCFALKDGEQTLVLPVLNPVRDQSALNLLVVDENGQVGDYYAFCGKGCFEE